MSNSSPHIQPPSLDPSFSNPETKALPPLPSQQVVAMGDPTLTSQTPPPLPPHPQTPDSQAHAHIVGLGSTPGNNNGTVVVGPTTTIVTPGTKTDGSFTIPVSRAPLVLPQDLPEDLTSRPVATLESLKNNPLALRGLADSIAYSPSPISIPLSAAAATATISSTSLSEPTSPSPTSSSASPSPSNPATPPTRPGFGSLDALISQQTTAAHSNATMARNLATKIRTVLPPRRDLAARTLASAQAVERDWLAVEADMYKALQPYTMESLHARMARAVTEAEQVSESLADSFLHSQPGGSNSAQGGSATSADGESGNGGNEETNNNGDDVVEFIKNYRKERKTYHMRREILERWREERVARTY